MNVLERSTTTLSVPSGASKVATPIKGPAPQGPTVPQGPGVLEISMNAPGGDIKKVTCRLVSPKNKETDSELKRYFRNNVIALAVGLEKQLEQL